ncbi:unnamed protein product [Psylliodes chrysocephalus]|uniref:PPPDE domain-containing protein n=1 Tax=Psylliodes chrysocephalus TaxID=3402493 RepID=A0A9P0DD66_9CUCU|nr:unnamed protein product [Psylliodes chrysocephala]
MASTKNPVLLYAYKLTKILSLEDEAWHVSVYVFGYEISYGNSGINIEKIMENEPFETRFMGHTDRTGTELYHFLEEINTEWTAETYDVLRNNCQHFAEKGLHSPSRSIANFGEQIKKEEERERRIALCERNKQTAFSKIKGLFQAHPEKTSSVIIEEISTVQNGSYNSNQIAVQRRNQYPKQYNNKIISSGRNDQITLKIHINRYVLKGLFYLILTTITISLFTRYV